MRRRGLQQPVIVIHSLAHASAAAGAAADAGCAITIASAPGAAGYAGAAWFAQVISQARKGSPAAQFESVLDCADMAGWALAAIRDGGVDAVRLSASAAVVRKVRAIARRQGIRVVTGDAAPDFDLRGIDDVDAACRGWIKGTPHRRPR